MESLHTHEYAKTPVGVKVKLVVCALVLCLDALVVYEVLVTKPFLAGMIISVSPFTIMAGMLFGYIHESKGEMLAFTLIGAGLVPALLKVISEQDVLIEMSRLMGAPYS